MSIDKTLLKQKLSEELAEFDPSDPNLPEDSSSSALGEAIYFSVNEGLGNVDNTSDLNKPISTATQNALDTKVDKITGYGLSENDFTDELLQKMTGIQAGAEVNFSTTASRTLNDPSTVLQAKGMYDHTLSGDHDGRYHTKTYIDLNLVPKTVTISAGNGLEGGGDLSNNVTLDITNPFDPIGDFSQLRARATTKGDVGLGNVDNTSDLDKPISTATQNALDTKVDNSLIGKSGGIAELDNSGKVPLTQLSDEVLGQLSYKGTWDPSTNTPNLSTSPAPTGDYYVVSGDGDFGGKSYKSGDWIVGNGSSWDKIDNTDKVSSVNNYRGAVNLSYSDVGALSEDGKAQDSFKLEGIEAAKYLRNDVGGTIAGSLNIESSDTSTLGLKRTTGTGYVGLSLFDENDKARWLVFGGNDTSMDLQIQGRQSDGSYQWTALTIDNVTGISNFKGITVGGDAVYHEGNKPAHSDLGTIGTGDVDFTNQNLGTGDDVRFNKVEVGRGSGSVALTTNDGHGNANVAFNHKNGVPEVSGSSARIESGVDNNLGYMRFELGDNVTSGTEVSLTGIMHLTTSKIDLEKETYHHNDVYLESNSWLWFKDVGKDSIRLNLDNDNELDIYNQTQSGFAIVNAQFKGNGSRLTDIGYGATNFANQYLNNGSNVRHNKLRLGGTADDGVNNLQTVGGTRTDTLAAGTVQNAQESIDTDGNVQIRGENKLKMGGFDVQFNSDSESLSFNFVGV